MINQRIKNEIEHGKYIVKKGEEIWNWSTPTGKIRWQRRCDMFRFFLGDDNKKVLEIGCGTGLFTQEIAKTNNQIIAIDISDDLINLARERVNRSNVIFKVEDACATAFDSDYFDYIIGSSVLHHLDVDSALKEFYRILKPGGKLMFTEPNMLNPQIALQKNFPLLKKWLGDSPDETAFLKWKIRKKLKLCRFIEIKIQPFDFLHPAIPGFLIKFLKPALEFFESLPLLKEIAGSLVIKGGKKQ